MHNSRTSTLLKTIRSTSTSLERRSVENQIAKVLTIAMNGVKAAKQKYETAISAFEFSEVSYESELLKFEFGKTDFNTFSRTKTADTNSKSELLQAK